MLSVQRFDARSNAFSDVRTVYESESSYPAWPAFLADGRLVLVDGADPSMGGKGAGVLVSVLAPPRSSLVLVDADAGSAALLYRANGYVDRAASARGVSYLRASDEADHVFHPTVLPSDEAEHSFVCFDAFRRYLGDQPTRNLWCSALGPRDPSDPTADVSSPAFFLPGQDELSTALLPVAARDAP